MKVAQFLNRYCQINFGYNSNSQLVDYVRLDLYRLKYRTDSITSPKTIQIDVSYIDDVIFNDDEQRYGSFEVKNGVVSVLTHKKNTFSSCEIDEVKTLILNNLEVFNFQKCLDFSNRGKHYIETPPSSKKFNEIIRNFNPCTDWELSITLWLFAEKNYFDGCTRSFFINALDYAKNSSQELQREIEDAQADFFGYDNPPNPKEYWEAFNTPVNFEQVGISNPQIYKIEGLDNIFCIEFKRKVYDHPQSVIVNLHLIWRDGIYRPFNLPCQFYSSKYCSYIQ